jgi:decaprenyl-phosphate phosphoribosyltransferase
MTTQRGHLRTDRHSTPAPALQRSLQLTQPPLLIAMRPRQWVKNLIVLAAPMMSGQIGDSDVIRSAAVAFVAFCLAASAVYLINDTLDLESDRAHPRKRTRPLAAGLIGPRTALATGAALAVAALLVALLANPMLCLVIAVYIALFIAYSLALKHEPVLDLVIVASAFLLRAVAGGVAADIPLSEWFLLTAAFGSLFMVAGKRYGEMRNTSDPGSTRPSLTSYTPAYLRFVWSTSAGVLMMTYGLWAFQMREIHDSPWAVISMAPFVIAVLRYAVDIDAGKGDEPEEIALSDRVLQLLAVCWLTTALLAVYV